MRTKYFLLAAALLQCSTLATAQKLTGNSTGSGISCIPDAFSYGLGQGCGKDEACCPRTNTCVRRTSCAEFARICPPPSCGKDTNFNDLAECPAEVTKVFKSPKGLKCQSSSDALCFTNGTAMAMTCTNAAGSLAAKLMVMVLAAMGALLAIYMS